MSKQDYLYLPLCSDGSVRDKNGKVVLSKRDVEKLALKAARSKDIEVRTAWSSCWTKALQSVRNKKYALINQRDY